MDHFYFSVSLGGERMLCLAPLTERRLAMVDEPIMDTSGYFLFEQRGEGDFAAIDVIAKVTSDEAVEKLRQMFNMA